MLRPTVEVSPVKVEMPRRVTVNEIARKLGLSQPAVSQVLNGTGRISEPTRRRVLEAAAKMGYRPSAAARAMITQKTRQVGVLVLNNPRDWDTAPANYFTILGMNEALEPAGFVLCLVRLTDVREAEVKGTSRVFSEHVLDGMIVTAALPDETNKTIERLVPRCVWADNNVWRDVGCVRRDEYAAGAALGRAIIAGGYEEVVYVNESPVNKSEGLPHYSRAERRKGFMDALRSGGVRSVTEIHKSWIMSDEFMSKITPLLRPEVAIGVYDVMRLRLVAHAALRLGKIPGVDFGVGCCEGTQDSGLSWPEVARVDFDRRRLGRAAAQMMLDMLDEESTIPESILLKDEWVQGTTLNSLKR